MNEYGDYGASGEKEPGRPLRQMIDHDAQREAKTEQGGGIGTVKAASLAAFENT